MKNLLKVLVVSMLLFSCSTDSNEIANLETKLEKRQVANAECIGNIDIPQANKDKITNWLDNGYIDFFGSTYFIGFNVYKERGVVQVAFGNLPVHYDVDNGFDYSSVVYRIGIFNDAGELVQEGCMETGIYVSRFYLDVKGKGNYTLLFLDYPDVTRVFNITI